VTQASARANGESESSLGIVFDKAILKDGQEIPLNLGIQALLRRKVARRPLDQTWTRWAAWRVGGRIRDGWRHSALGGVTSTAGALLARDKHCG